MPASRHFLFPDCQAGVFHVVSRLVGRAYYLEEDNGREEFVTFLFDRQNIEKKLDFSLLNDWF
jgi:hypothetical protein